MSNLEDSIFLIRSAKKANVIGTGFIFHKQQNYTYLLTCAHVIQDVGGEENIRVNKLPAEVIKIGDVQGFDVAILKINTTFSASSLNLRILDGKEGKKLEVKIPGYYLFGQNNAFRHQTIRGKMIVEVDGHKAIQIIENVTEKVAVGKLEIKKGMLRSGYSGAPVIDINTESVVGLVTHKIDVDGKGKSGVAISIEALEQIWPEMPASISRKITRESPKNPIDSTDGNKIPKWWLTHFLPYCLFFVFLLVIYQKLLDIFDRIDRNQPHMSQKNSENNPKIQSISDLCPIEYQFLTCGEEKQSITIINFPRNNPSSPKESSGRSELTKKNYKQAVKYLTEAWGGEGKDKDPSLLIAMNNAKIMQELQQKSLGINQVHAISVAIPFSRTPEYISENILRGVAWKQEEFNNEFNNNNEDWKLLVLMADDSNDGEEAQKIADEIGRYNSTLDNPILGFIGHYSSRATINVINKYHKLKINQITPSATSTRESLKYIFEDNFRNQNLSNPKLDFSFFFRTVGTTKEAMDAVRKYIDNENIENVIIFRDSTDAFALSSYSEAKKQLLKTGQKRKIDEVELHGARPSDLRKELKKYKNDPLHNEKNTVIFLFMGAYTESQIGQVQAIIEENKGDFLLIGNNPVYTPDFLKKFNDKSVLKNIIIRRFWVPSESDQNIKNFQSFWDTKDYLITRIGTSYDATEMFIQAISKKRQSEGTPTPEEINNALLNTDFIGMTGKVKIIKHGPNKGDRQGANFYLIKPYCEENGECRWMRLNPY
ncbi:MAG: trypsin-like peptidase domain-containing protein [Trichodesmium sp. MAG_R02]|nr:trypsin-like peptidase domain-containing protein [Trichodesmium sp. MAG_R02]